MQMLRLVFLFGALFGFGLFLQPSAYASAHPAIAASAVSHCETMSVDQTADRASHGRSGCEDMQADCVFSTTCISPLYKPDEASIARSRAQGDRLFSHLSAEGQFASSVGPEPPPPQSRS